MAFKFKDRVKETTTTTGTGNIILGGAATGYKTFTSSFSVADTFHYCIDGGATGEWEVGLGTLVDSTTFARTTVTASSTGSLVSLSAGTKSVFATIAAASVATFGLSVYGCFARAAAQTIATGDAVTLDTTVGTPVGMTRSSDVVSVPAGTYMATISATVSCAASTSMALEILTYDGISAWTRMANALFVPVGTLAVGYSYSTQFTIPSGYTNTKFNVRVSDGLSSITLVDLLNTHSFPFIVTITGQRV